MFCWSFNEKKTKNKNTQSVVALFIPDEILFGKS